MPSLRAMVREAWDRFLLYLPLACMGLLALGTYWMVRTEPPPTAPTVQRAPQHDPDYFMEGFSIRSFDAKGRLHSEIMGDKVRHYPDTRWLDIEGIRIRAFDARGRMSVASADRGLTPEDGSEVQLMGNARVVREASSVRPGSSDKPSPRLQFKGDFLHAFMRTEQLLSHRPVELQRGIDRFSADRLEYDNVEQVLQLSGRVRGTLWPGTDPVSSP